jgi:hypothetical protein
MSYTMRRNFEEHFVCVESVSINCQMLWDNIQISCRYLANIKKPLLQSIYLSFYIELVVLVILVGMKLLQITLDLEKALWKTSGRRVAGALKSLKWKYLVWPDEDEKN